MNKTTVREYVNNKIAYLKALEETGKGKAIMAELRHGVGQAPGEMPALWGILFEGMPEKMLGSDKASNEEWAIYTALTLYAMHPMQVANQSIGRAAAHLVKDSNNDVDRILNRFKPIVTATNLKDVAYHLRNLLQLLETNDIPLDYAELAQELSVFNNQDIASDIKLRWARDFYSYINNLKKAEKETKS